MQQFWKDKRVFLSGHTGFKGGWLGLCLGRMGARVRGYALEPPSEPSLFSAARLSDQFESIHGDVRELESLQKAMADFQPDVVFHLAAQALVRRSYSDPVATYATNVMGTVNLLAAVRTLKKDCAVVNVTSDKCYQNNDGAWSYRENDPMGGHDPYSSSKGCAELVSSAFHRSFFAHPAKGAPRIALASARAGNVIGGGDWGADRLVPDCFRALGKGRPVRIRSPEAVRPWQHVLDPLNGYLRLAQRLSEDPEGFGGGWNFGPAGNDELPVFRVVENFLREWPDAPPWESAGEKAGEATLHEAAVLRLDCTLAHDKLGWKPRLNLEAGLKWCAEWYKRYQAGEDALALTLEQIDRYDQLANEEGQGG